MLMKGYIMFFTEPGEFEVLNCWVCNKECDVERNIFGPTNWISAMAKRGKLHDEFRCPNSREEWHVKALKLLEEKRSTESDTIKSILDLEISKLVLSHK